MTEETLGNAEPQRPLPNGFWGVEPREGVDGSPDINFRVLRADAPQSHREFKNAVERALTIVKALFRRSEDDRKLREAVAKLLALSQVGLVGANASPLVALDALRAFEADIVERESGPIKNNYMRILGIWSLIFALLAMLGYQLYSYPGLPFDQVYRYRNIFLVWAGCMVGTWASFASRKVVLTFNDLVALEEDRIEPPLRLLFTGVLTIILALVFITGVADIEIGKFRASKLVNSGTIAVLLGAFAGLAEKALPSTVMSRANSIVTGVKSNQL